MPRVGNSMPDVLVERSNHVATITFNRPQKYNAFDPPFIEAIRNAFRAERDRAQVRGIVLTGAGKAFSAGGDITAMRSALDKDPKALFEALTAQLHPLILDIRACPKPVVAAVNGAVAGGGNGVALACDARLASESASFKAAYAKLGVVPDGGITFFLPRLVGFGHAQRIILRDESVRADEALRLGLVDAIVSASGLLSHAQAEASRLGSLPPETFERTKELLTQSYLRDLKTQIDLERRYNAESAARPALREGVAAFLEKREPVFRTE